ncbi:uncharacterized protein A4U43_C08F3140 [Asparagus officinalis]|nr:uncharacterized protein A4U43_C08F3140 [Asparagus officinalis]
MKVGKLGGHITHENCKSLFILNFYLVETCKNCKICGLLKCLVNLRHISNLNLSFNMLKGNVPNGGVSECQFRIFARKCCIMGSTQIRVSILQSNLFFNFHSGRHLLGYILPVIASTIILVLGFCQCYRRC